jgi:hypothetical protein
MEAWVGADAWAAALAFLRRRLGSSDGPPDVTWGEFLLFFVPDTSTNAAGAVAAASGGGGRCDHDDNDGGDGEAALEAEAAARERRWRR